MPGSIHKCMAKETNCSGEKQLTELECINERYHVGDELDNNYEKANNCQIMK